ncbi:hypothetical protein [Phaeobacter inhibens]|uniref:hypothetical protein n=1 Tax=Phaeobacter inhibens TaxID=221822 RepID=UPI001438DB1F|nr:hypothetical protein [Phaeobacter inhibens]
MIHARFGCSRNLGTGQRFKKFQSDQDFGDFSLSAAAPFGYAGKEAGLANLARPLIAYKNSVKPDNVRCRIKNHPRSRWQAMQLDLSRFCAAPGARLGHFSFEYDGAFPAQC